MFVRSADSYALALLYLFCSLGLSAALPSTAHAFDFVDNTHLGSVDHRTRLYEKVQSIMDGRYDLAHGETVEFEKWYKQKWIDISFEFITDINERHGLIWGFSTGEWGEKYVIDPSIRLGFATQFRPSAQSAIQFSASWLFKGRLREKPCTADYGEIGGVQVVNCRLAATLLEPSETLKYLLRASPKDRFSMGFRYQLIF